MSTRKRAHYRKKPPSQAGSGRDARAPGSPVKGTYWLYGTHAVVAALHNPDRTVHRLLCNKAQRENIGKMADVVQQIHEKGLEAKVADGREISDQLGENVSHQGIAALVSPLKTQPLEQFLQTHDISENPAPILVLDQVTDPHNVGAILRSAAAFNVVAIVVPKDHAAAETAAMAKSACGALELVPLLDVTNLARGLKQLKEAGYWIVGMDGDARDSLHLRADLSPVALVLGAEGKGLRRLTVDACDLLVKLPMDTRMESLNVSNAAAIALYQLYLQRHDA